MMASPHESIDREMVIERPYKVLVTTFCATTVGSVALSTSVLEYSSSRQAKDAAKIINDRVPLQGTVEAGYYQKATLLFKE